MSESPRLHVLILNWNGAADTLACLESVLASQYENYRLIVCDNDSADGSPEQILQWAEGRVEAVDAPATSTLDAPLTLIRTGGNLGFTGGCNVGIAHALGRGADFVFLLNNDARVEVDTLSTLVEVARDGGASLVGARVLDEDGVGEQFAGSSWPGLLYGRGRGQPPGDRPAYWPSAYGSGCGLLIGRGLLVERFAECGHYLDPAFFMYCEETDLCLYGRARGHGCVVARDAVIRHGLARSSGGSLNPRSYYYMTRNRIRLANRWLDARGRLLFHAWYAPSRVALQALGKGRWRARTLSAVARGLVDGYLGRAGKWGLH